MVFIQEIIYLYNKGWGICNKSDGYKSKETHWTALHVNTLIV